MAVRERTAWGNLYFKSTPRIVTLNCYRVTHVNLKVADRPQYAASQWRLDYKSVAWISRTNPGVPSNLRR